MPFKLRIKLRESSYKLFLAPFLLLTSLLLLPSQALAVCGITGQKVLNQNQPTTTQISSINVILAVNSPTGLYVDQSRANPFNFPNLPGNNSHTISLGTSTIPANFTVGYTFCEVDLFQPIPASCHTSPPTTANSVLLNCPDNKYIDFWWHFTSQSITAPNPNTPRLVSGLNLSNALANVFGNNFLVNPSTGQRYKTLGDVVSGGLTIAFLIAAFMMLIWLVWGAYQYLLSGGNKEGLARARARMTWALVGFLIVMLSFALSQYVQTIFPQALQFNKLTPISVPPAGNIIGTT